MRDQQVSEMLDDLEAFVKKWRGVLDSKHHEKPAAFPSIVPVSEPAPEAEQEVRDGYLVKDGILQIKRATPPVAAPADKEAEEEGYETLSADDLDNEFELDDESEEEEEDPDKLSEKEQALRVMAFLEKANAWMEQVHITDALKDEIPPYLIVRRIRELAKSGMIEEKNSRPKEYRIA